MSASRNRPSAPAEGRFLLDIYHSVCTIPLMQALEIMAPAGSFESLAAALRAGADSVYFGVGMLYARTLFGKLYTR